MNYSTAQISNADDCNALLNAANFEKEEIGFRKLQQERQYRTVTNGTAGVEAELAGVTSEIVALETAVAGMNPGPTKDDFESKLVKLRYKKFLLEERKDRYGIFALMEKEYTIACIEKELLENEAYIEALNQRKAEIG